MKQPRRNSSTKRIRRAASGGKTKPNATSTSVARAFAILDILSPRGNSGLALMDTAKQLQMSKSTTHRYLISLEKLGAVERDDKDRFRLGMKMIELAGLVLSQNNLHTQGEKFINELADRTHETVHLAVPSGTEVVYIAKADSARSIRMVSHIGSKAPMYCTSLGKAILAHSSPELVDEVIQCGLLPRTPHTITSQEALLDELERVRIQGYAMDSEENEIGVSCVGSPIFDYTTRVIGAISVSGPTERMTVSRRLELAPIVRDAGVRLSNRMGYPR